MRRVLLMVILTAAVLGLAAWFDSPVRTVAGAGQSEWFSHLDTGEPIQHGNLTIFPVFGGRPLDASAFLTLDEGLSNGLVKVGELGALRGSSRMLRPQPGPQRPGVWSDEPPFGRQGSPSGSFGGQAQVNQLAIQNLSDRPLILLDGEIVTGGKQDRVVARDRIIPPNGEPVPLDVFCVEPGRWQGISAQFLASKSMAHPKLRQEVTESRNQQRVWNEVAESRRNLVGAVSGGMVGGVVGGVFHDTTSYARTVQAKPVQDQLSAQQRALAQTLPANTVGVVVAVGGRVTWADVFTSPALFARYRDKLLQSYAVEATRIGASKGASVQPSDAADFLRPLTGRQTIDVEPQLYRLVRTEAAGTVTYELQAVGAKTIDLHMARMER